MGGAAVTHQRQLTRDGLVAVGTLALLGALALFTGNNLVYLLLSLLVAGFGFGELAARANLAGLVVSRTLPEALFAGHTHRLLLQVRCPAGRAPARGLTVLEVAAGESARFPRVAPGSAAASGLLWTPTRRGLTRLDPLIVESAWPFGLVTHRRILSVPADVVVYPTPRGAGRAGVNTVHGEEEAAARVGVSAMGDLAGLRPYQAGDAPRRIHWPTSARRGEPMVVLRSGEGAKERVVRLHPERGARWEAELCRAAAQILRFTRAGDAVGLVGEGLDLPARTGEGWARGLLERLARLPERP